MPEPYRSAGESPFITYGDRKDYGVDFATRPDLGSDGRLLQSNVVALSGPDAVQDNDIPAGQCRGFMADPARSRREAAPTTGRRGAAASAARVATRRARCGRSG